MPPSNPLRPKTEFASLSPKTRFRCVGYEKGARFLSEHWHPADREARATVTARYALRLAEIRDALEGEKFLLSVMREYKSKVAKDLPKCQERIEVLEGQLDQLEQERKRAITVERQRILRERKSVT